MLEDMSKPIAPLSDLAKDCLREEHKQRRQEIDNLGSRTESDQRNGLIVTGAIWSWLATNVDRLGGHFYRVIVFLPAVIMLFFFYRWLTIEQKVRENAKYVQKLEGLFDLPREYGWEHWLDERRTQGKHVAMAKASRVFWTGLIIANVILAVLFIWIREW